MISNIGGLQSMKWGRGEARKRPGAGSEGHLAQDELISNMARPKILHHILIAVLNQSRLSGPLYQIKLYMFQYTPPTNIKPAYSSL
jgi:hypothetical protein